jgi:hypothetical protein
LNHFTVPVILIAVLPYYGVVDGVGVRRGRTNRSFITFRGYSPPHRVADIMDASRHL